MAEFFQDPPRLANPFAADAVLRALLERQLPAALQSEIFAGLTRLGARAAGEMLALAERAEAEPPRHVPFDPWGRRVDRIEVSPAWSRLHEIAAEEGIVATAYERSSDPAAAAVARLHQFARLYLYHPSSAIYSCPLAMTDGAARVIELHGDAELRTRVLPRLLSRDPATFSTSGQWMTERAGGSDVGRTATEARPDPAGGFRLHGVKWFTSATTADMALTLARLPGAEGGSRGLTLFHVEPRDAAGRLQGIEILRLKDKLGTRALPTAELALLGTPARRVGEPGRGVATIATMLNITRLYNACCAAGYLARAHQLASDYATRREAFGRRLIDQPLHAETLAAIAAEQAGALHLVFRAAALLGREESGAASDDERALLRLLTPIVKALTAKQAVAGVSEALECFGGAGYIEESGLPRILRDAQVLSIWEGTTNVLSLDFLRAVQKEGLAPLAGEIERSLGATTHSDLVADVARVRRATTGLAAALERRAGRRDELERGARQLALGLARALAGALLLEQAAWELARGAATPTVALARRWAAGHLAAGFDRDGERS